MQEPIIDRAIAAGVHIMVANGNTGEFYALTLDEAEAMVQSSADMWPPGATGSRRRARHT